MAPNEQISIAFSYLSYYLAVIGMYAIFTAHVKLLPPQKNSIVTSIFRILFITCLIIPLQSDEIVVIRKNGYWVEFYSPLLGILLLIYSLFMMGMTVKVFSAMDVLKTFYGAEIFNRKVYVLIYSLIFASVAGFMIYGISMNDEIEIFDSGTLIFLIGLFTLIMAVVYGLQSYNSMLHVQRVWEFMIVDSNGMLVYEKHIHENSNLGNLHLFANAIYASTAVMNDGLEIPTEMKYIEMNDRSIFLHQRNGNTYILIADHYSDYISEFFNSIIELLLDWETENIHEINMILPNIKKIDKVLNKYI